LEVLAVLRPEGLSYLEPFEELCPRMTASWPRLNFSGLPCGFSLHLLKMPDSLREILLNARLATLLSTV